MKTSTHGARPGISAALLVAFASAALVTTGCASSGSLFNDADGRRSGELVFARRCNGCHDLPAPGGRDAAAWRVVMQQMAIEAKLDAADKKLVTDWLVSRAQA